jgi:hypothetical protein
VLLLVVLEELVRVHEFPEQLILLFLVDKHVLFLRNLCMLVCLVYRDRLASHFLVVLVILVVAVPMERAAIYLPKSLGLSLVTSASLSSFLFDPSVEPVRFRPELPA